MGRQMPDYCEHGKCFNPGDESFGLSVEHCMECQLDREWEKTKRFAGQCAALAAVFLLGFMLGVLSK